MKTKPCDWICVGCKNVNYSFRKSCNRCQSFSRDTPGTRYIPNVVVPKPDILQGLKLEDTSLQGSGHSTAESNDDNERENVVFSQALLLQDLSQIGKPVKENFSFLKKCKLCSTQNYFYQQSCQQCGFSSFA